MKRRIVDKLKPIDSNTLLLLHFDGNFKDEVSGNSLFPSSYGDKHPVLTDSYKKFGESSLTSTWSDSDDGLIMEFNDRYNDTKKITIEFWMRSSKSGNNSTVRIGCNLTYNESYAKLGININYAGYFLILNYNPSIRTWDNVNKVYKTPIDSKWHHVALVCDNGKCVIFIDGKKVYSTTRTIPSTSPGDSVLVNCNSNDCIDEVRISDTIRYDSDFTPQDKQF